MIDGNPIPPDAPPPPPPPPPPPGAPPGSGDGEPGPQPPGRRLIRVNAGGGNPLLRAVRDAAVLAFDALDYAGDRVAVKIAGAKRPSP